MKKIISTVLLFAMVLSLLAGCTLVPAKEPTATLEDAKQFLVNYFMGSSATTDVDYTVPGSIPVNGVTFAVVWTTDNESIKVVPQEDGKVLIDLPELGAEEVTYTLTATITDAEGKSESLSWNHILPATMDVDGMTYEEIVEAAYALADGTSLEDTYRLYGEIVSIDTAWSEDYKNITVTIQVGDMVDKPIMCYRLKGEGAKDLKVGDKITVEGVFKNYKGTIEFDAGCTLVGMGEHPAQAALLKAAFALGEGDTLAYPSVMTGVVTEIPTAFNPEYGNVTVNIQVEDKVVQAYRLKGEGADKIAVGDTVTVAGIIKNYKGTIEFDAGCVLLHNELYNSAKNALSGYKLLDGEAQVAAKTITGEIVAIDTPYSADYKNITVTIQVGGLENYKIMCYRLKGEGAEKLAVGDTITVTGILKNYKGTIEFDAGCELK